MRGSKWFQTVEGPKPKDFKKKAVHEQLLEFGIDLVWLFGTYSNSNLGSTKMTPRVDMVIASELPGSPV